MEEHNQVFDICIVCAMYEEAEAVLNEFSARCSVSFESAFSQMSRYAYRYTTIQNKRKEPLSVLVTWPSDRGPVQTGLDLSLILQEFRPRFSAMTGICAGDRKKVKLGDLIIAECAYLYEEGKVILGPDGEKIHLIETETTASTSQVIQYAKGFDGWKEPLRAMKRARVKRELKPSEEPRRFIVPMASGMAVRSDNPFRWLRERFHRNTIAIDMEAATFYRAFGAASHIHALVVKGVSDYGDGSKNDTYHEYAARASAVYLLSFIQEYVTEQTMPRRDVPPPLNRAGPPEVWNVPHARNPHFTGRDDLLDRLHQQLTAAGQDDPTTTRRAALTQSQAIKGLGGIGKTQIAIEYAYRSRDQGRYIHTLWINAASEETLTTSFVALAELLPSFPAKNETDRQKLVEAIKRWLEQWEQRWLLILDNADELPIIQEYLPRRGNGSILLTTRANAVGSLAASIEVEKMGLMEGTQFLLRRAQRFDHTSDEEINEATNVVIALDHFPLALDQAGAYIEETKCGFVDYLQIYQTHRKELLARRGLQATNYPDSVATTWSLSFHKVEQANPAAAELFRLCAFLAADKIPEELIRDGAAHWSPPLQYAATDLLTFNQMIAELLKFSLVERLAEIHTLSIHRLVQAVQIDTMEPAVQRQWAERVVRGVNEVFPRDPKVVVAWPQCLRYLEQVQACDTLIRQHMLMFIEAADLLSRAGIYLSEQGLYPMAEPLHQQVLAIREQQLGPEHPDTATTLDNLAGVYRILGRYAEAELLYHRARIVREKVLGSEHVDTARTINNMALLYRDQGRYIEAESLYQRARDIREKASGPDHPDTARTLDSLAGVYRILGRYAEAEPLYRRALAVYEKALGPDYPDTAATLNNLGRCYQDQSRYAEAEPLYRHALVIYERVLGPDHPDTATVLDNLAQLYRSQGEYVQAEAIYQRILAIREKSLGPEHSDTATTLIGLALLYRTQGRYGEAEPRYQRALTIKEKALGPQHPDVAATLNNLARLYYFQGRYAEAEPLYQRALAIYEKSSGPDHHDTALALHNLAQLYRDRGWYIEAEPLYQRALAIYEKVFGPDHSFTAITLNNLARLYYFQGRHAEAESLYQRALAIYEKASELDYSNVANALENYADLLRKLERTAEAAMLETRAKAMRLKLSS
jgi:tetratricopeptide (TPR) repeat protein/nucleoside phosphorylase